jgi:hypothetical protein
MLNLPEVYTSTEGTCTFPNCDKDVYCRTLCVTHYHKLKREGKLPLLRGSLGSGHKGFIAEWIDNYKTERGCIICKLDDPAFVLDLHHRDPATKKFGMSRPRKRTLEEVEEEAAKCVVLCANHHREVEWSALSIPPDDPVVPTGRI